MKVVAIIAVVILVLFILTFIAYITNADGKMIEKVYNALIKKHDEKVVEEKI